VSENLRLSSEPLLRARSHLGGLVWLGALLAGLCAGHLAVAQPTGTTPRLPLGRSRVGRVTVTCPCCGHQFEALAVWQTNTREGVDRDLFARALGPQPVFYRVSTCTNCYYSGYLEDFQEGIQLPPDFIAALTGVWPQAPAGERDSVAPPQAPTGLSPSVEIRSGCSQRDIPALVRYQLAAECYRSLQRSDEALAWLCLRASWVVREENSVLPPTERFERMLKYARRWLPPDSAQANQADRELAMSTTLAAAIGEGHFNAHQQPYAELVLAMLLRRHGENAPACHLLKRLLEEPGFSEELAKAARRMYDSIEVERHWQHQAARHFNRALRTRTVAQENQAAALYLLGELHRRLGDYSRAVDFFNRTLQRPDLPSDLRDWALAQKAATQATH